MIGRKWPRLLVHHIDGQAQICRLPTEAVAPECTVRQTQASSGGVVLWVLFTWDTLGIIIPITQFLTAVRYLNIVAYQVPCHAIESMPCCMATVWWAKVGPTGYYVA